MIDFIASVKNVVEEEGKTIQDLFNDKIISENTFYKYKHRYPSLNTLVKIANYLKVSIDYLFSLTTENNYLFYNINNQVFYDNLVSMIENKKISQRQFCNDLNYAKDNINRWKNGTTPSVQTLLEISKYFNCLIDDLLQN